MHLELSDFLELLGALLVISAAAAVDPRAGAAVLGLVLLVAGYLIGSPQDGDE